MVLYFVLSGQSLSIYLVNSSDLIVADSCEIDDQTLSPCVTLQMVVENLFPSSDIVSIMFIHQLYTINDYTHLTVKSNIAKLILKPWKLETVDIICIGDFSFRMLRTDMFTIQSIRFIECGKQNHLLELNGHNNGPVIEISHAEFSGTKHCSIMLMFTNISLVNFYVLSSIFTHGENFSIYVQSRDILCQITNTTFINNSNGSVYFNCSGSLQIEACLFANNKIHIRNGSAILINRLKNIVISNSTFLSNYNTAMYIQSTLAILSVRNGNFTKNKGRDGGVFHITCSSQIYVLNSYFIKNRATQRGAVMFGCSNTEPQCRWTVSIIKSKYLSNLASRYGTVLCILSGTEVNVNMNDSIFLHNAAKFGGVFHVSKTDIFVLHMTNVKFMGNTASTCGVIRVVSVAMLKMVGGSFINNTVKYHSGAVCFLNTNSIQVNGSEFNNNVAIVNGGALYVNHKLINASECIISHCSFIGNKASLGGAIFMRRVIVSTIICDFYNNSASSRGGALYLKNSTLTINKFQSWNNSAQLQGGSIAALQSHLYFKYNSQFNNDKVTSKLGKGGAIYIENTAEDCKYCFLRWSRNSTVSFKNTSAPRGRLIYGGMIRNCNVEHYNESILYNGKRYDTQSSGITSQPLELSQCKGDTRNFKFDITSIDVVPGKTFYAYVACLDQLKQAVSCDIRMEYQQGEVELGEVELGQGQSIRHIRGCTQLPVSAFSANVTHSVLQLQGGLCNSQNVLKFNIFIHHCPIGFDNIDKKCQCDQRLKDLYKTIECNINSDCISLKKGWLGFDGNYLRASKICPLNYCFLDKSCISFSDEDKQCNHNRSGILCGQCILNYSVILGSWECSDCSNSRYNAIWLTILIALAGVILVGFLMLTKMTVSKGTINGLILYGNVISFSGLLDQQNIHPVLRVIMSWINLDLGIKTCFYSGMDVHQKTWLQFIFPFYVWVLVLGIIVVCHYSPRIMKLMGMRNVEDLATLFLLSYTKILKTISTVFSVANISVANATNTSDPFASQTVWAYDGNIDYLGHRHLPLFIMALLFLLFLFLPYTLLLVFGQCLRSLPRRKGLHWVHGTFLSSILDAYHAPYSRHHRYWTGLGLMFRCWLFIIFSVSYSIQRNLFWTTLGLFIFLSYRQLFCTKIYQSKFSDLLEVFYLTNLGIVSATLLYSEATYPLTVSITVTLLAFFVTFIYHAFLVIKEKSTCGKYLKDCLLLFTKQKPTIAEKDATKLIPTSTTSTFIELRESLLD